MSDERTNEITNACVQQILDNWDDWQDEANAACQMDSDADWCSEMQAKLWHVVKAAVEEAKG